MPRPKVASSHISASDIAASLKRERPDLDQVDYLYLLYADRVGRIVETVFDKYCRARFGISGAEMRVLLALRRSGPPYSLRPTQLFRSLLVTSGAITKQVDRLMAGGFADRQPGPERSGGFLIHLTTKGFDVANEALTALADSSVVSNSALSPAERRTVLRLLEKILLDLESRLNPAD
jgi:DNA-binding MarR family transcriptional regulator